MKENSIEEAIERLEYIDRAYSYNNYYSVWDLKCIEILLSDYKRVLKENEELNNKLSLKQFDVNIVYNDYLEKLNEYERNTIQIQRIKDKIKEIDKKIKYEENEKVVIYLHKQKNILQELLESEE